MTGSARTSEIPPAEPVRRLRIATTPQVVWRLTLPALLLLLGAAGVVLYFTGAFVSRDTTDERLLQLSALVIAAGIGTALHLGRKLTLVRVLPQRGMIQLVSPLRRRWFPTDEIRYVGLRTTERNSGSGRDGGGDISHRWGVYLVRYHGPNLRAQAPGPDSHLTVRWQWVEAGEWIRVRPARHVAAGTFGAALADIIGCPCLWMGEDRDPQIIAAEDVQRRWSIYGDPTQ
ncbi:MAG: hypothetical protein HY907_16675 [Deltaproteobacteria bacterium]|nr:hypothetical protein [Deltaproteobacteria bacterium]